MPPCNVLLVGSKCSASPLTGGLGILTILRSTPVGLQFEKFIIPDAIRILDAIMETLAF
jgi:hypothetical protein